MPPAFYQRCSFWFAILFLGSFGLWLDAVMNDPGCPEVNTVQNFQIDGFFGRWYVALNTEGDQSDIGLTGDCAVYDFSLRHDFLITVSNHAQGSNNNQFFTQGRARWPEIPLGLLELKIGSFNPWRSYQILETDYINYALVHTCSTTYGAWTKHETQFLTRSPQKVGTRAWEVWISVAKGAIQRAF